MTMQADHNENDRSLTSSLIDISETLKHSDIRDALKTISSDWAEAVIGWKLVSPSPRLVLQASSSSTSVGKKRRTVERSVTDIHANSNQQDGYWSSSSVDHQAAVRCIGDDFESFPVPPWKSNVEKGTYRYVPENGSYRTMKFMWDDRKDWYTIRKRYPEKVSTAWHQNYKRMQRDMKRQIKKDLSSSSEKEQSPSKENELSSGENTSRSDKNENKQKTEKRDNRALYRGDPRVKSTQSDSAAVHMKKMNTIVEGEVQIPQQSIPRGTLVKSASDLFIENFSSRLIQLEEEIQKDSKWLRKTGDDTTKQNFNRAKYREPPRPNLKESNTTGNTPRMPTKTETLTTDIFSVKQVTGTKDLKPLEKTRSYRYGNQNGDYASSQSAPPYGAAELDKTLNSYKAAIENTKQSLFNTLTGTKIHTHNTKKPPKGFSVPSTITICDKGNHSQNALTPDQQSESVPSIPSIGVRRESNLRKGPIQGILPEISGKRLEVATVSHRLL